MAAYNIGTVIHVWYSGTCLILCYMSSTVLHVWYCDTCLVLWYMFGTVVHFFIKYFLLEENVNLVIYQSVAGARPGHGFGKVGAWLGQELLGKG